MPTNDEIAMEQCRHDAQLLRERIEAVKREVHPARRFTTQMPRRLKILEDMLDTVETEARRYERMIERSKRHD